MHTALAAWVAVLAAALGQSEPAPCASSFALESHAGAAHHGDVCRGPKGAWQCPRGCATSATGPLCVEDGRPCRRPAACLGRGALVAGRGSRGDACVVAQEKKPDVWSCPTDCAAVAAPSDPGRRVACIRADGQPCVSHARRSPCRDNATNATELEWHDERWHGDVCREPDGNFHCPVDCSRTHGSRPPYCLKARAATKPCRTNFGPARPWGKPKPKVLPGWGFEQPYSLACVGGPCDVVKATSLDIVVAAYDYGTAPVVMAVAAAAPARVAPVRAFLYCKGPAGCDPADVAAVRALERVASVEAIPLPNVGRCDHAYATHAVRRRDDLADATLFLKDTTPWHVHLGSMVNVLGLARALPANLEAFCARAPISETLAFELPTYESEQCYRFGKCYADESYQRASVRPLGAWLTARAGVRVGERGVAACLGGAFGAGREAIRRTPAATYAALASELSAGDSLEAGHFAERAWFAFFGVARLPPLVRNRAVVYAFGDAAGLDLPSDRAGRDDGWDYLYFVREDAASTKAPRGWRLVFSRTPATTLKAAPHRDPRLAAYAHSLYVEARPDVRAAAEAVATALSAGASVALRRRAVCCAGHRGARARLADEALLRGAGAGAGAVAAARRAAARSRGPAYASTFVLRRHTEAAAAFNERWLARITELGPEFADVALMAAAAASGATVAAADEAIVDERPGAAPALVARRRQPLATWVFLATADSSEAWAAMAKKAVASARARTSLEHIVCVFRGGRDAALARWLEGAGVEVLYHDAPAWAGRVSEALSTKAGRDNVRFSPLYESASALTATFLRVDIPLLLDPRKHGEIVLYADADVAFLRDVRREDFGAGADPAYFTMGAEFMEPPIYGNAGVMLLNLIGLRRTYAAFADWTFSDANVRRGLHFGKFGPGDQGAYAEFYEGAFAVVRSPSFNWRPYWRARWTDPAILHFHGPKPDNYREALGGGAAKPPLAWRAILKRCRGRGGAPCADWLRIYDCLPEEVGDVPTPACAALLAPRRGPPAGAAFAAVLFLLGCWCSRRLGVLPRWRRSPSTDL